MLDRFIEKSFFEPFPSLKLSFASLVFPSQEIARSHLLKGDTPEFVKTVVARSSEIQIDIIERYIFFVVFRNFLVVQTGVEAGLKTNLEYVPEGLALHVDSPHVYTLMPCFLLVLTNGVSLV